MHLCFRIWNTFNTKHVVVSSALTLLAFCLGIARAEVHVVQTTLGNVTGGVEEVMIYNDTDDQVTEKYVQYLGIPYAEPPTGNRRFSKPEPKTPWSETHNGTFYRPSCHSGNQQTASSFEVADPEVSEDCLTLNIYAPFSTTSGADLLPVVIFIHGSPGTSTSFVGDVVSAYGQIVVVVINYRQGYLGFLSTSNDVIVGNFGLWDQQMAMTWVNEHISAFGGDPDMLTLIGHSTGASDAILQTLYSGNRGLIKGVIAMSGTPIPTHLTSSYMTNTNGSDFVSLVDCGNQSSQDVLSCLRMKTVAEMDEAVGNSNMYFKPVIDGDFVKASPLAIMNGEGTMYADERNAFLDVDLMLGLNNKEGGAHIALMWAELLNTNVDSFIVNSTQFRNVVVPTSMKLIFGTNISESVIETVTFQYSDLSDPTNSQKIQQNVVDLSTDIDIAAPLVKTANIHSMPNMSGTYLYQFSEEVGTLNPLTPPWLAGANRADDVYSLFGFSQRAIDTLANGANFTASSNQRLAARHFMTAVANFAKTGNPALQNVTSSLIPTWPPYEQTTMQYLDISHGGALPMSYFRQPFMTFWTSLVPALLLDTANFTAADDNITETICPEEIGNLFKINMLTAENIILALSIMSASLLLAVFLICGFSIAREGAYKEYNVRAVQQSRGFDIL